MDRHDLMEFLRRANINLTQNNLTLPANVPFGENITAYTEGRWSDIESTRQVLRRWLRTKVMIDRIKKSFLRRKLFFFTLMQYPFLAVCKSLLYFFGCMQTLLQLL